MTDRPAAEGLTQPMAPEERQGDPFFALPQDSEWNACIGPQGDEENYADGYIEAAREIAGAILEKEMFDKRDTLAFPILYNARHAIELYLKLVVRELLLGGVLREGHKENHDILSHLEFLEAQDVPDRSFRQDLSALRPFVQSLAQIDSDGQEFRFHKTRDGQRSIKDKPLVNIRVIAESLETLRAVLSRLKLRASSLRDEWPLGVRTSRCSRRDLFEIASALPQREDWASEAFDSCKESIKEKYGLENRQFSLALNKIQETRDLAAILGIEKPLLHLSDQKAEFLVRQWEKMREIDGPTRTDGSGILSGRDLSAIIRRRDVTTEVVEEIARIFSEEEFADAATVFFMSRDGVFSEVYESKVRSKLAEIRVRGDLRLSIRDIVSKLNFREHFVSGLRRLGRLQLSARLGR